MNYLRTQFGFTLLELLIAIALVGILSSLAVPAFQETMARSRLTSATNLMVGSLNYAKSEAIDRQQLVIVRPVNDDWEDGWEVVADPGGGAEEQLKVYQSSASSLSMTSTDDSFSFAATGFRDFGGNAAAASNVLVEDTESDDQRRICVNIGGGVRVTQGEACQ